MLSCQLCLDHPSSLFPLGLPTEMLLYAFPHHALYAGSKRFVVYSRYHEFFFPHGVSRYINDVNVSALHLWQSNY